MNKNVIFYFLLILLLEKIHDAQPIKGIYNSKYKLDERQPNKIDKARYKIILETRNENIKRSYYNYNKITKNDKFAELKIDCKECNNSKIKKKLLRKLENKENIIIAWFNVINNGNYKYIDRVDNINDNEIKVMIDYVYLDDNTSKNYNSTNLIPLNEGKHKVTMIWNNKLTSMRRMFMECRDIISLDLSNFDTSEVFQMSSIFDYCSNLESIDISNFDTSKVSESIGSMFRGCYKLKSLNLAHFKTSNIKNFDNMFNGCSSLESLDISNFDISNGINFGSEFNGCNSLKFINLYNYKGKEGKDFFSTLPTSCLASLIICTQTSINGKLNDNNVRNSCPLDIIIKENIGKIITVTFNITEENGKTVKYINQRNNIRHPDYVYLDNDTDTNHNNDANKQIQLSKGIQNVILRWNNKLTNIGYLFSGCPDIISIDFSFFDTSEVTYMGCLFQYCSKLESVEISNLDTSKTEDIGGMLLGCSNLKLLNLSSFDTSKVTYFWNMFQDCSSLVSLNLSNFETSKATEIMNMFNGCSKLTFLDISNFDISNIPNDDNNLNNVFLGCNSLNFINLYHFKGQSVDIFQTIPSNCFSNNLTICHKHEITGTLKNNNAKNICPLNTIMDGNRGNTISVTFNITEDIGKSVYYMFHND